MLKPMKTVTKKYCLNGWLRSCGETQEDFFHNSATFAGACFATLMYEKGFSQRVHRDKGIRIPVQP